MALQRCPEIARGWAFTPPSRAIRGCGYPQKNKQDLESDSSPTVKQSAVKDSAELWDTNTPVAGEINASVLG